MRFIKLIGLLALYFVLISPVYAQSEHVNADTVPQAIAASSHAEPAHASETEIKLGNMLPIWSVTPFVLLLLAIAILPLTIGHWWEKNLNKAIVSFVISLPIVGYLLYIAPPVAFGTYKFWGQDGQCVVMRHMHPLLHSGKDYVSFIILLGALFIISGGIYIKGKFAGTPLGNTIFLGVGAVLANLIGTTGASMVLIRPVIRANENRRDKTHIIVFFIFLVSNIGGLLTPLGDPPLFLGFLKGMPFEWTLRLWPQWLVAVGIVLLIFNLYDQYKFNREDIATPGPLTEQVQPIPKERLQIEGKINIVFLTGVVAAAFFSGYFSWRFGVQEGLMLAMSLLSMAFTKKQTRQGNAFTFSPIIEVAVLFIGIFITMVPAILILNAHGSQLGLSKPWHFFWGTGLLSSFLDNAPTYLTFTATASGLLGIDVSANEGTYVGMMLQGKALQAGGVALLMAISCGSVFMGANTYIGNGPNFMVKAVAEENGVKMPSFFGYMLYSLIVLIPVFVVISLIFFRGW